MTTQPPNGAAVHSPAILPPEEVWRTTLRELELQNKNFIKYLYDSTLVQADVAAGSFTVQLRDVQALEWVTVRLRETIQRTLAPIIGRPVDGIELRFTVAGQNGAVTPKLSNGAAAPNGRVFHSLPDEPPPGEAWHASHRHIGLDGYGGNLSEKEREALINKIGEREKRKKGGRENGAGKGEGPDDQPVSFRNTREYPNPTKSHVKTSHYAIRFWLPLLGVEAFTLLVVLSSYAFEVDNLNRAAPSLTKLAAKLGYSDTTILKGRKAYGVARQSPARPGLFDRLREHHLCLHRTEGYGKGIKHFFEYLTKVEDLPVLTPRQVARLSEADQHEHAAWLRLHEVDPEEWAADERGTAVPPLPEDVP